MVEFKPLPNRLRLKDSSPRAQLNVRTYSLHEGLKVQVCGGVVVAVVHGVLQVVGVDRQLQLQAPERRSMILIKCILEFSKLAVPIEVTPLKKMLPKENH